MIRIIIGLILIIGGLLLSIDAHDTLNNASFDLAYRLDTGVFTVTDEEIDSYNSPALDLAHEMGADTYTELGGALRIIRVGGIFAVIAGVVLIVMVARQRRKEDSHE